MIYTTICFGCFDQDDGREKSPNRKRPKKDNKENKEKQGTPKKDGDKQSTKTKKEKVTPFFLMALENIKKLAAPFLFSFVNSLITHLNPSG